MSYRPGFIAVLGVLCFFGKSIEGCRQKCEGQTGIQASLRPFFSECMGEKLAAKSNWKHLVNYVVWDDMWFKATESFYCKGRNATCWVEQLSNLLKPSSYMFSALKECIQEYGASSNDTCETVENPVYRPRIFQKFKPMIGCPVSPKHYLSCLASSAITQTFIMQVFPGQKIIRPTYNFVLLSPFLNYQRANCRVARIGFAYVTSCSDSDDTSGNETTSVSTREKRALSLKDLLKQSTGRLNFRLSGTGVSTILPSGPLRTKVKNVPKCFAHKLQMVIKSRTVLSTAASKCNDEENTRRSRRVSTSFVVASVVRKQPGQVGSCKSNQVWSNWYNRDDPAVGTGDLEYFSRIRSRHPRDVCFRPTAIQALLVKNNKAYNTAMQKVKITPTFGLSCHNYKQRNKKCEDYKVRFCCPRLG